MSFDSDKIPNKMMTAPPDKKGFHFASDGVHLAEFIEAETIEEAQAIYAKIKRLISPTQAQSTPTQQPEPAPGAVE